MLSGNPIPNDKTIRWINPPGECPYEEVARAGFEHFLIDFYFRNGEIVIFDIRARARVIR